MRETCPRSSSLGMHGEHTDVRPSVHQQTVSPVCTCHHHQTALVALRTALDVDACEASHHGRRGFPGQHGQRELREEAATHCQFRAPTTIAYYPLVTNAHEPGG